MNKLNNWWESFKERGYALASLGAIAGTLTVFTIMAIRGIYRAWEPNPAILWTEIGILSGILIWGIERLIKDWLDKRR